MTLPLYSPHQPFQSYNGTRANLHSSLDLGESPGQCAKVAGQVYLFRLNMNLNSQIHDSSVLIQSDTVVFTRATVGLSFPLSSHAM